MQKHLTLYPNSPSDAAAEAPASPLPTTMMSYLRLLLGETSFNSFLRFVHFSWMGHSGTLPSNWETDPVTCAMLTDPRANCSMSPKVREKVARQKAGYLNPLAQMGKVANPKPKITAKT